MTKNSFVAEVTFKLSISGKHFICSGEPLSDKTINVLTI